MRLPDGLLAVVKRDCPTCELVAPVLSDLHERAGLIVFTQDDASFPADADWVHHDADLAISWHNGIETVPTLVRVSGGAETARTVGWSRAQWERFCDVDGLGPGLPEFMPGCGSLSVDPAHGDALTARFSASSLRSRRIELAELEDEWEAMWDRGWSDGLPVVPPDRGQSSQDAGGHDTRLGRRSSGRPAEPDGMHRREGRCERGDGGLQAGVSARGDLGA